MGTLQVPERLADECTDQEGAVWKERHQAGYTLGRRDGWDGEPRADILLAEVPPDLPGETGAAYVKRNLHLAARIGYTSGYWWGVNHRDPADALRG